MKISEYVHQFLTKAYSAKYQKQYQEPMAQHFRDQLNAVRGYGFWCACGFGQLEILSEQFRKAIFRVNGRMYSAL